MNKACSMDHLADDGNFTLLGDDVVVGAYVEMMVVGMAQSH
jgi:hypothetical protein